MEAPVDDKLIQLETKEIPKANRLEGLELSESLKTIKEIRPEPLKLAGKVSVKRFLIPIYTSIILIPIFIL